jgi:hypothetical protein
MRKNITFSAEEDLIVAARRRAAAEHSTLNDQFRRWLQEYVATHRQAERYEDLMQRLSGIDSGGSFPRDELNRR